MKSPFGFLQRSKPVTADEVISALSQVLEPEVNRDLVSLGMISGVAARGGVVSFTIRLRDAGSPLQVPIERRARRAVLALAGVQEVRIAFETGPRSLLRETTRLNLDARYIVAVASGKGGVGKSTIAVNLAAALARAGHRVGLLDGDIHGPNVPLMMGLTGEQPFAFGDQVFPPQAHGVTVMSMGLLVPPEAPVIWRGPMLHQAIRQLLRDVMWGQLDFLIVDLPPGTGDVQLTLTQSLPLAGAVMVTTPQEVALADVLKGGQMFRQLEVPVLGVVENMSYYLCPHCGRPEPLFGEGGAQRVGQQLGAPVLGQIPLDPAVRASGDAGLPIVLAGERSQAAAALLALSEAVEKKVRAAPPRPTPTNYAPDPQLQIIS